MGQVLVSFGLALCVTGGFLSADSEIKNVGFVLGVFFISLGFILSLTR